MEARNHAAPERSLTSPAGKRRQVRVPQQERSRRTRETILEAAVLCFESRGYEETTTALIAQQAGIGVGTLYSYFHDKREILLELLDSTVREVADWVIEQLDPERWRGSDPRAMLRPLIDAIFHSQRLRPGLQRILWERYFKDEEFRKPFEAIQLRLREAVDSFADDLDAQGLLRDIDRASASFVIVNCVQWNASQAFLKGSPAFTDATAEATADLLSRYVFVDPAEPEAP
ncbi:MAG: TetR/AcrR family transcriptional regulator [Myxococcales bacterium]|nr:TetR/AcrR family transcriptional regulator [Myxococcales bacterium]